MTDFTKLPAISRRSALKALGVGAVALAGSGALLSGKAQAEPVDIKTVKQGVLTLGTTGDMPLGGLKDGKPIGTDLEMAALIGERLGLAVEVQVVAWPGIIESVRGGRIDWMGGNFAWTPQRAKIMQLTDGVYFPSSYMLMRQDEPFKEKITIADLKDRNVGTVTGFNLVPDMKKVPGTKEVKLYDSTDSCMRDVIAGRLDFAVLDGPVLDYIIAQNPDFKLKQVPLQPDPAYPAMTGKFSSIWGVDPSNNDLFDAMNQGLGWLQKTGGVAKILAKYGLSNPDYLTPMATNPRVGVDRDAGGKLIGMFAHEPRDFSRNFA